MTYLQTGIARGVKAHFVVPCATRAMRDLIRLLLRSVPSVCLFVRPENAPAIRVYEAVGMRRHGAYRSLIF